MNTEDEPNKPIDGLNKNIPNIRKIIEQSSIKESLDEIAINKGAQKEEAKDENIRGKKAETNKLNQQIENLKSDRKLKEEFSRETFVFMKWYIVIVGVILLALVACEIQLQALPLTALIGTIPASMALFGWVLRGLFPSK